MVGYVFVIASQTDKTGRAILKVKGGRVTSKLLDAAGQTVHHWNARCKETDRRLGRDGADRDNEGRIMKDNMGLVVASIWK